MGIPWNYVATSHGKGPLDGIGSGDKCGLLSGQERLRDAAEHMSNINVVQIRTVEINERYSKLKVKQIFQNVPTIKGINSVYWCLLSQCNSRHIQRDKKSVDDVPKRENNAIKVSSCCVVEYDGVVFPGEVKATMEESFEVLVYGQS